MARSEPRAARFNRRSIMAALSASTGLALAGCLGDDDDGDDGDDSTDDSDTDGDSDDGDDDGNGPDELGEPVEQIVIETYTGLPAAAEQQDVGNHLAQQLEELGVSTETGQKELLTFFDDLQSDAREQHIHLELEPPFHQFMDAWAKLEPFTAEKAGNNNFIQNTQYASCEYSNTIIELGSLTDPEQQQDLIDEAVSIASNDVERLNLFNTISQSAYRTDQLEIEQVAAGGINDRAYEAIWNAEVIDGDDIIMNIAPGNIADVAYQGGGYIAGWTHYPFAPLTYYNLENERSGNLAEDWEWSNEAQTLTVDLREGQTFHNGEEIIAEDVQWTYQWLQDSAGQLGITSWPYDSIDIEDDHRIAFNFTQPSLHFEHFMALYGILYPEQWIEGGAEENPNSPEIDFDNIIGSGAYRIENFNPEQLLDMRPHDGHWATPNANFVFQGFADFENARQAFMAGEINIFQNMGTADQDLIESQIPDVSETYAREDIADWYVAQQMSFGATKFREFRLAVSHIMNRELINSLMTGGLSEPLTFSSIIPQTLPSHPDNPEEVLTYVADSTEPDFERAREVLEEEGWGWDDDDNLHYPADADLDPLWPQGDSPVDYPEEWPCVEDLPP